MVGIVVGVASVTLIGQFFAIRKEIREQEQCVSERIRAYCPPRQ